MSAPTSARTPRRPRLVRAVVGSVLGGLLLGLGVALLLVQFGRIGLGTSAPWVVVASAIAVRVALALVSSERGRPDPSP